MLRSPWLPFGGARGFDSKVVNKISSKKLVLLILQPPGSIPIPAFMGGLETRVESVMDRLTKVVVR